MARWCDQQPGSFPAPALFLLLIELISLTATVPAGPTPLFISTRIESSGWEFIEKISLDVSGIEAEPSALPRLDRLNRTLKTEFIAVRIRNKHLLHPIEGVLRRVELKPSRR